MKLSTLQVGYSVRPARLAFLVEKPERATVREVIEVNTTLWGGVYNPILIADGSGRVSTGMQEKLEQRTYEEELLALVKEFDPDFIVNFSGCRLPSTLQALEHRTIQRADLRWKPGGTKEVGYFLEVWPFLHGLWEAEFKGSQVSTGVIRIIEFENDAPDALFLAAQFCVYPPGTPFVDQLCSAFGAISTPYNSAFRELFIHGQNAYPVSLTALKLTVSPRAVADGFVFFLLDPTNVFDVVDFWNLRATGALVFPLPISSYREFSRGVCEFAKRARYPINPRVVASASLIKARSISDERLSEVGGWMSEIGAEQVALRGWYPRFGLQFDRVAPDVEVSPVTAGHSNVIFILYQGFGTLQGDLPPCELRGGEGSQQWSAELRFGSVVDDASMFRVPWLNRECDGVVARRIGHGFGLNAARASRAGLVIHQQGSRREVSVQPIPIRDVVDGVLKEGHMQLEGLSTAGLAVERILVNLGHLYRCQIFRHSGVREVLSRLEGGGESLPTREIVAILERNRRPTKYDEQVSSDVLDFLTGKKILRPGLVFQCAACGRHAWYHVSKFDEQFTCEWCFVEQPCPRLDTLGWHYKSDGLFKLEGKIQGSLSVILAVLFLKQYLDLGLKYYPSFLYRDGVNQREADFMAFSTEFFEKDVQTIVGEAKTNRPFTCEEVDKLKEIGKRTHAYLAFCTLASAFSDSDKQRFESLIQDGQRLILLTANHLDMSYEDLMEYKHKHFAPYSAVERLSRASTIEALGQELTSKYRIWI